MVWSPSFAIYWPTFSFVSAEIRVSSSNHSPSVFFIKLSPVLGREMRHGGDGILSDTLIMTSRQSFWSVRPHHWCTCDFYRIMADFAWLLFCDGLWPGRGSNIFCFIWSLAAFFRASSTEDSCPTWLGFEMFFSETFYVMGNMIKLSPSAVLMISLLNA